MTITIDPRFCGPPDSGNGGYVCGLVASEIDGPAEVTLRSPPPLDRPLDLVRLDAGRVELRDGDTLVAEAVPRPFDIDVPPPVALDAAVLAAKDSLALDDRSPFRTCFVCGSERTPGDGLCIFPGPVAGRDMVAAPWLPDASLAGDDGVVRPEFIWSALDCPSGFGIGIGPELVVLLGRFAVAQLAPVQVDRRYVVIGWSLGGEGRKMYGAAALFDEDGATCGYARATWLTIDQPAK